MIFKNAAALQSKAEKTFLVEKVELFINTVSALEEKFGIGPCVVDMNLAVTKLKLMGLILDDFDMLCLKKMLPINLFSNLVYSATSSVVNDDIMGQYLTRFSNTARSQEQARKKQKTAPTIVDLFCGAGGLSLGFQQVGFKTLLATDFDPLCVETYKFNHPEVPSQKVLCEDIRTIARDMKTFVDEPVDVIIGGPPCQGFSSANKHHRVIDDPRNELYKHFLKVVEMLTPKFVVMENVKGMRKVAPQVVEDYMNMRPVVENTPVSYCVSYRLLNSVDFSVAQSRERLIYIAIRSDIAQAFGISPDDLFAVIEKKNINKPTFNLSDALEGLRSLKAPHKMNVGEVDTEESGRKIECNRFDGRENEYLRLINTDRCIPLVMNHKARYCSELNYEIYKRMCPGDDATDPKIADIMPYAHRNDKFKDKYYRLYADRPCRTITAHMRSDCHSHIHPYEDRALTPREAARAQSFPDDYMFLGPYLLTYRQIGNAVPVVMARAIAEVIKNSIPEVL